MAIEALKLTSYFGERDRSGGRLLAEALFDIYERHGVSSSALFRGIEGFGLRQRLHSQRLLTLSEDLPVVSVAVDARARIEGLLGEVSAASASGLITLERARLLTGPLRREDWAQPPADAKLTVYLGRHERVGGVAAHVAVVDLLQRGGVAGATVLLGVDGTAGGVRRRARFFAANAAVPLMVISVGAGERIAALLAPLSRLLAEPVITLERVRVCKRDGRRLADPGPVAGVDAGGLAVWQKLMVFSGEHSRYDGRPLHQALIGRLRAQGAAGVTALRGLWGYHGDHAPHGERFFSLTRQVPVVTVIIDRPERIAHSYEIVDELTRETGLVTSELVPALRARAAPVQHGGLRLADL